MSMCLGISNWLNYTPNTPEFVKGKQIPHQQATLSESGDLLTFPGRNKTWPILKTTPKQEKEHRKHPFLAESRSNVRSPTVMKWPPPPAPKHHRGSHCNKTSRHHRNRAEGGNDPRAIRQVARSWIVHVLQGHCSHCVVLDPAFVYVAPIHNSQLY